MFDEVWNDVYDLDIDKTLFRAWAQYNNEPPKGEHYRTTIVQSLSSISCENPGTADRRCHVECLGSNMRVYAGAAQTLYEYSGGNPRVYQSNCTWTYGSGSTLNSEQVYFYSVAGQRIGAYRLWVGPSSIWFIQQKTEEWFGAKLVNGTVSDRVGSFGKYYPYGEDPPSGTGNPPNDQEKFATYTRDSATGLDYAMNRYYNSVSGSFMTPDPYKNSAGPKDPGSWNRYSYAGSDPVGNVDAGGLDWCPAGASADLCAYVESAPDDPATLCVETAWNFGLLAASTCATAIWSASIPYLIYEAAAEGQAAQQAANSGPEPCPITVQSLADYMLTTPAYDAQGSPVTARPLAAYAGTILADAIADNVDPRLLVAVAFVEGKWGGDKSAAATDNSFGILNLKTGKLRNFTSVGGWAAAIAAAANTLAFHIGAGQSTIDALYSGNDSEKNGGLAAYCVGGGCAAKISILTSKLIAQGGNPSSLASPCYLGQDGKYYQK
ncbi:MAG TPA: RHS repeat-associated core domain-containing protein [Blastocatellia bacterium]|nr:RHS repeat-associated core domain-containing protein [Blastocatellia bacterium]